MYYLKNKSKLINKFWKSKMKSKNKEFLEVCQKFYSLIFIELWLTIYLLWYVPLMPQAYGEASMCLKNNVVDKSMNNNKQDWEWDFGKVVVVVDVPLDMYTPYSYILS